MQERECGESGSGWESMLPFVWEGRLPSSGAASRAAAAETAGSLCWR